MEEPVMRPVTKMLSDISQMTGDVTQFIHLRFFLEDVESREDDPTAQEILKIVKDFHALCTFIRKGCPGDF